MKAVKNNRTKFITFRLTPEEYTSITERCKTTTARKISIYMRSIVLEGKGHNSHTEMHPLMPL